MKKVQEKEKIVLVGGGQHSRVVIYNIEAQGKYEVACILDSDEKKVGTYVCGVPIVGNYSDLNAVRQIYGTNKFFIAFGAMKYRKSVFQHFINSGWEAVNIIHPQAVIAENAKIGKGVLIECGCLITPNPIIGDNVVVNTGSQVNHDNIICDHVYIASGVLLSGCVRIGENTLLDDGVIVTIGKCVGKNCIIGAGAVVTKNIPDAQVAYGNPARIIRENT